MCFCDTRTQTGLNNLKILNKFLDYREVRNHYNVQILRNIGLLKWRTDVVSRVNNLVK